MAENYSTGPPDRDFNFSPNRRRSFYSPPRRRRSTYEWDSDDSYTYAARPRISRYYSSPSPPPIHPGVTRPVSRNTYHDWDVDGDDYKSDIQATSLTEAESGLTYEEVESEGLSKTFAIPKTSQATQLPLNFHANTAHPEWNQPEAHLEDGSISRLLTIHASEYSLTKDGRQMVRLMCPDGPPPTEPSPSAVQFRWLHIQRQFLRLDDLNKLVINSPYISNELRVVALNVLSEVRNGASRKLVGGPYVESGSILRGTSSHNIGTDSQNQPVIFLSSPYLLLSQKPSVTDTEKGQRMFSLLESLYGYDVESDRQDTGLMKRMSLEPSKGTLHVPQLWCLLVGNDVLVTLSELTIHDLTKDLIEIDRKVSGQRRPLTVKVLDQYRRPHNIVIEADCNYVDFLRHTFALAKEGAGTCVTDYELLNENRDLVTPQEWLTLVQQGKLEDAIFCIVPRFQLQQQQLWESRSRSRSRSQLRNPQREAPYDLTITGVRRPPVTRRSRSKSRVVTNEPVRRPVSSREWITGNRTMSPEPDSGYDPNKWALVKYSQKSSGDNHRNLDEAARGANTGRKLITWDDELGKDKDAVDEEPKWSNQIQSASQHRPYVAEDMQIVLRKPSRYMSRTSSGISDTHLYPYRQRNSRRSRSRPRRDISYESFAPLRSDSFYAPNLRRPLRSNSTRVTGRHQLNDRYMSRPQRLESLSMEPNIIINDSAYDTMSPNLFSLGDLSGDRSYRRSSLVSSDTESDNVESNLPSATSSDSSDSSDEEDSRGRRPPTPIQRQGWYKASDGVWRQGDSPRSFSEQSDAGYSNDSSDTGRYPKRGKTKIPVNIVSIRAVIDLGYPFVHEGDMIVLQVALNSSLIGELLRLSKEYKTAEAKREEPTVRLRRSWSDSSQSRSRSRNSADRTPESNTSPKIKLLPFFHWKVRSENDSDASNADVILVEILVKSDEQLRLDKLYNKVYACTIDDLLHRHTSSIKETMLPKEASVYDKKPTSGSSQTEDENGSAPVGVVHTDGSSRGEVLGIQTTLPKDPTTCVQEAVQDNMENNSAPLSRTDEIMASLLELSQELLGTFLPQDGSAPYQQACKRFWGSLDEIFRQITWSSINGPDKTHWVIHDFTPNSTLSKALPRAPTNKKTFADCSDCSGGKIYTFYIEALDHLHSEHLSCMNMGRGRRPYDDPCFVWLGRFNDSQANQTQNKNIMNAVNRFMEFLTNVKDLAMELHYLVATTSHQSTESQFRPFLPSGVFYAFQEILSMYFFTSRQLSYINALESLQSSFEKRQTGPYWRKINSLESDAQTAFLKACELLESSKEDIILSGIATQSFDTLGIESVGPHFLAAALAVNLQNRPLFPDKDTDVLQVYHEYTSKLRYQTYRRPRRRVFLDIHRLQEDLEALHNVVSSQIQVLDNYKRLLSPTSFRVTDTAREGLFRIESRYINSQMDRLQDQNEEIRVQRKRMRFLKEQVKQTIEILEENHGKAIRVFTIVTVFFLPLSFVTSFFGMNTTDIRDTNYDQRLFWTVSLPVTFAVLALAFFYGYKGDTIEDRILTLLYDKNERRQQPQPKKTVTWGTVTSENSTTKNTSRYHLPSWVKPVRQRRKLNDSGVKRRPTDMSYLST